MSAPNGGPAFPSKFTVVAGSFDPIKGRVVGEEQVYVQMGMTMRQYYKAAALQVIDSRYTNAGNEAACVYEVSRYAGLLADAMLAEDEEHATPSSLTQWSDTALDKLLEQLTLDEVEILCAYKTGHATVDQNAALIAEAVKRRKAT